MATPTKFFVENSNLFTDPQGTLEQQEKYNLYNGLVALCNQLDDIEKRLQNIESIVINLVNRIK